MRIAGHNIRRVRALVTGIGCAFALVSVVMGQSQESKPALPATPVTPIASDEDASQSTGVSGSAWEGPNWGVTITWDPSVWSVEDEFVSVGYDGLRIGTPLSTVFVEAYEGFGGDPQACLAGAEAEIHARVEVSEVTRLDGRPLPTPNREDSAQLYGLVVTLDEGTPFRIVEFVECRTLASGEAVLELTWRTSTEAFTDEFPRIEALFAGLETTTETTGSATPTSPDDEPVPPIATPVA